MALDLHPEEIHRHALNMVRRAHRKAWPLRLKIQLRRGIRSLRDLWGRPI
jgi:hypothetical protein